MSNYIIEIEQLTKVFKPYKKDLIYAVKNVTLQIKKGEIFCLTGPNGAGKTTLLKMLCGLIIPTNGLVKVAGYDILKNADKIKPLIGMSGFAENSFFARLTIKQNLEFFSALYNLNPIETKDRISSAVEILGIENGMDKLFQNLSSGMKQRIAIARSLLSSFEILLLDEPTRSLDTSIAMRLKDSLKKIAREQQKTIFYITHNLKEAREFSHRIAFMNKGEIKFCGESSQDLEQIFNHYVYS